jgi:phage terminase large subunit GpA-like protein
MFEGKDNRYSYRGNINIKGSGIQHEFTIEQIAEYNKCKNDCAYFISNYVKIISNRGGAKGLTQFKPYGYQNRMIEEINDNRFVICKIPRQYGKSTIVVAVLLWYVLFTKHYRVAVLAHKGDQAVELLKRVKMAFEYLPTWLQQGVTKWNEGDIAFENGSFIQAAATSSGSVRGRSYDFVYMDELAHVELNEQEDFFTSTFPTITSGDDTKLVITSTPKGMEMFYKIWTESERRQERLQASRGILVRSTWA